MQSYGKLVLVRHANGYVTVYADNDELEVAEGDTVKRGQIIAKSGQTGADARLRVADCFAGRLADLPYFVEYERPMFPGEWRSAPSTARRSS